MTYCTISFWHVQSPSSIYQQFLQIKQSIHPLAAFLSVAVLSHPVVRSARRTATTLVNAVLSESACTGTVTMTTSIVPIIFHTPVSLASDRTVQDMTDDNVRKLSGLAKASSFQDGPHSLVMKATSCRPSFSPHEVRSSQSLIRLQQGHSYPK